MELQGLVEGNPNRSSTTTPPGLIPHFSHRKEKKQNKSRSFQLVGKVSNQLWLVDTAFTAGAVRQHNLVRGRLRESQLLCQSRVSAAAERSTGGARRARKGVGSTEESGCLRNVPNPWETKLVEKRPAARTLPGAYTTSCLSKCIQRAR